MLSHLLSPKVKSTLLSTNELLSALSTGYSAQWFNRGTGSKTDRNTDRNTEIQKYRQKYSVFEGLGYRGASASPQSRIGLLKLDINVWEPFLTRRIRQMSGKARIIHGI